MSIASALPCGANVFQALDRTACMAVAHGVFIDGTPTHDNNDKNNLASAANSPIGNSHGTGASRQQYLLLATPVLTLSSLMDNAGTPHFQDGRLQAGATVVSGVRFTLANGESLDMAPDADVGRW